MDNGDVAGITKDTIRLAGKVTSGEVYIDGTGIGDIGSQVIRERKCTTFLVQLLYQH